jgi:hypothetical protein
MTGNRSVEEAREFFAKTAVKAMAGGESDYTQKFLFDTSLADTGDPDEGMMMKGMAESAKDVFTEDEE